jgi:hypothetical protein
MTASLTTLIGRVQDLFIDDGTRFTTATVTAAIRQALKDFNTASPQRQAETQDVVSGQYEYELTYMTTMQVLDVLLEGTDSPVNENHTPLAFTPFVEDQRAWIRLQKPLGSGTLIFRYTRPHTVLGLDGGVESTLQDVWDNVLVDGACYYACLIRTAGQIGVATKEADISEPWQQIADMYHQAFKLGLVMAASQPAARVPDKTWQPRVWNDEWHNFPA